MIFIKILKNTILFGKANPLGKAFEKQMKTNEDQGIKQVEALKVLKPEENKQLKLIEGIFLKIQELMKFMKLKNGTINLKN